MPENVDDFLISDANVAKDLGAGNAWLDTDEQLLVQEEGNDLALSLYINDAVLSRLDDDDPIECLHGGNFSDFCIVLEGVSHFLYLLWNARFERPVSLLELELQAEVDKYVVSSFLFSLQSEGQVPPGLSRWLFANPAYDDRLDRVSRQRYEDANYYAQRFCTQIEDHYFRRRAPGSLIKEVRRFYRLTRWQKIDCIEALPLGRPLTPYRLN